MKRKQLQQTSMEVTVGAFMMMILLALGFFTIILSRENIFMRNYRYHVRFTDVSGLIKGDKVYVHGVDVGRVAAMSIDPDNRVLVELSLREKLTLRKDYKISVLPSSVLGGRYVAVAPGSASESEEPEGGTLNGTSPADFIAEATEAVISVRKALEDGGVLSNIENTMKNLSTISDDLAAGKGTAGKLLKDETLYEDLKVVAANLKDLTGRIKGDEGTVGRLFNDETLYTNAVAIADNLRQISDRLAQGRGTVGKLLSEDDTLYSDLSEAAASIKEITATINKGEGTLGKLAKDEQVYDQLNKLLGEIRATVDDLRETSPVASFSSIFFGAF
jgi:phospholipid/cholesterol/gamma-HCH transport system substrate-binding protein